MKNNFEKDIDYLNNILSQDKIIGNKLIFHYDDNEFFEYVNEKAEEVLLNAINAPLSEKKNYYIVIISLSFISLKFYDGGLWEYVGNIYKNLYRMYSEQKIYRKILDILDLFSDKDKKRYINFPISNAIVPEKYLDKYFEFMFDIYKINFQKSLPDNINEELKFVFEGLSDSISGEKDDLEITVTNKTYKLIKTTLSIIKDKKNIDSLIELSSNVLKYIDAYYWNDPTIEYISTSFYEEAFKKWKAQNEEIDRTRNINILDSKENRSAWKSKFKLIENEIYLFTPVHRIPKDYEPTDINIFIYNGDEPLSLEERPIIEESIGGYIVKPQNVKIDKPIGRLTYVLSAGKNEIYNSKDSLYRNYIAFDNKGNELKNNTEYAGDLIIASDTIDNPQIYIIEEYEKYVLGELIVNIGDYIQINNDYLNLSNRIKNPFIIGNRFEKVYALNEDKKINVYKNVETIVFETDEIITNVMIVIDRKRYRIDDLKVQIENKNTYKLISVDISDIEEGYHCIEIKSIIEERNIAQFEFIIDKKLDFEYEKLEEKTYTILLDSSFELYDDQENKTTEFLIDIRKEIEPIIVFYINEKKFFYIISLTIPLYKIDDKNWCEFNEFIWGRDIEFYSKIILKNIDFDKLVLTDVDNTELKCLRITDQIFNIDFLRKYIDNFDKLKLKFLKQEIELSSIDILNICEYNKDNSLIQYDENNNVLRIKTTYIGEDKVTLKIINAHTNKVVFTKNLNNNVTESFIKGLHSCWKYNIIFEDISSDLFSLPKQIYNETITLYNTNNLQRKYYIINKVYYGYPIDNLKDFELKNTFIWLNSRIDERKYEADIYQMGYNHTRLYKTNINPVIVEVISNPKDGLIEVMIVDNNEDGLLLDKENRTIYDGNKDDLDDIYIYELLLERKKN